MSDEQRARERLYGRRGHRRGQRQPSPTHPTTIPIGVNLEGLQKLLDEVNDWGHTPDAIRGVYLDDATGNYYAFGVLIQQDDSGDWVIAGQGTK